MKSHTISSARVILYVNGKPLAQAVGFSWSVQTTHKPLYGIDSPEPQELIPTTTRVTGSIRLIRVTKDGGAEGAGLTVPLLDLPREKYATIMLVDRRTDLVLFQANKVVGLSQVWEAQVKGMMTGTISFESLDYVNEVRPRGA